MAWTIRILEPAQKKLAKLDPTIERRIRQFLLQRVAGLDDPRSIADPLSGPLKRFWRYRVGDYRILCEFLNGELIVLVVDVDHRSKVYR